MAILRPDGRWEAIDGTLCESREEAIEASEAFMD